MLTREQNIFLAKKVFVELVYNTAYIEGCNVTFPQTQTIIDGAVVNGVTVNDINMALNNWYLKRPTVFFKELSEEVY